MFSAVLALNKTDLPGSFETLLEIQDLYANEEELRKAINRMSPECRPDSLVK